MLVAAALAPAALSRGAAAPQIPASFREIRAAAPAAASGLPARVARDALTAGLAREGTAALAEFVVGAVGRSGPPSSPAAIETLAAAADGAFLLSLASDVRLRPEFADWLFASDERWGLLAETVSPHDRLPEALGILETLYAHDPKDRDAFFELILAIALVWDQPRPPLHGQMGSAPPAFEPRIPERYDYFKALYRSGSARMPYDRLNVASLVFVVDTPAPLSELEWARKNVRGTNAAWGKKYYEIRYNQLRLAQSVFVWPHGAYTLANIEARGGLCVDQAYYAVLTARAWGIPAIFFAGPGRRGGHAWFAYLRGENRWEMDIGRYEEDRYQTGFAVHPQTNRPLTDHELAYQCERALRRREFDDAQRAARIAQVLLAAGDAANARILAGRARGAVPLYLLPWDIEAAALLRMGDPAGALDLWNRQVEVFRRFPDVEAGVRTRQAELLRRMGREAEAAQLMADAARRVGGRREDLARAVLAGEANRALEAGDAAAARAQLEALLRGQRKEGAKIIPLLRQYVEIAKRSGEAESAARFVESYANRLRRELRDTGAPEKELREILMTAYTNAGDERKIEALRQETEREKKRGRP